MDYKQKAATAASLGTGLLMTAAGIVFAVPALMAGSVCLYGAAGYFWWAAHRAEHREAAAPKTLFEDFERFSPLMKMAITKTLTNHHGETTDVRFQYQIDWVSNSDFAAVYLPSTRYPSGLAVFVCSMVPEVRAELFGMAHTALVLPGERALSSKKSTFSGRVHIYHEDTLTYEELAQITRVYEAHGMNAHFRGPEYAAVRRLHVPTKVFPPLSA